MPDETHVDVSYGRELYLPAITYALLDRSLAPFRCGWDTEIVRLRGPNGISIESSGGSNTGVAVTLKELYQAFGYDVQFRVERQAFRPNTFQSYYLPPKTTFRVSEQSKHRRSIVFTNTFMTLTIEIRSGQSTVGIGEYQNIFDVDDRSVGHSLIKVIATVKQNRLLNGHPEMERHRKWADTVIDTIVEDFSFEAIRARQIEDSQLFGIKAIVDR